MKLGIVGLPNVGKSTLFNAITNAGAQSANYPFCTIEPNIGTVAVPTTAWTSWPRCTTRTKSPRRSSSLWTSPALSRALPRARAWATKFLSNIREVDAIVHVVRCFEDGEIVHVEGSIGPSATSRSSIWS